MRILDQPIGQALQNASGTGGSDLGAQFTNRSSQTIDYAKYMGITYVTGRKLAVSHITLWKTVP